MNTLENTMYDVAQLFLLPTLHPHRRAFLFAFWSLGEFACSPGAAAGMAAGSWSRLPGQPHAHRRRTRPAGPHPAGSPRVASRVTPMLGLVATMIPMGPALKSLRR
jgi:hypothetical protein